MDLRHLLEVCTLKVSFIKPVCFTDFKSPLSYNLVACKVPDPRTLKQPQACAFIGWLDNSLDNLSDEIPSGRKIKRFSTYFLERDDCDRVNGD